ncbi:MAG: hypothetical protein A2176_10040 [Spirochaetes bacterium RBG_13_51_14]|nr:MAG: hypothetical protein A2176_10040 [Spirochaetes bacterium RBG_13_51_14]
MKEAFMALITEKVVNKAQKCKDCVLQKLREYINSKKKLAGRGVFAKETSETFYQGSQLSTEAIVRLSCTVCPNKEDFVKMYGMSPCDYFSLKQNNNILQRHPYVKLSE